MKAYVTGAGGMIGSHLIELLATRGFEVFGSFFHPTVDLREVDLRKVALFELDIRNHEAMKCFIKKEKPQLIFHLAAQSFPVVSWEDPYYTMDVNVSGTVGLFEAIRFTKESDPQYNPTIVVVTSSAIYGESLLSFSKENLPKEDCPMLPLHPYGVSKAAQDLLCFQYFRNFGLKISRVRLFNCTGTRKVGDISSDLARRAVEAELAGSNRLVVGNLTATRAIIDVRDVCEALLLLAEKGSAGEAYNVCSSHVFPMTDVVKSLESIMGKSFELVSDSKLLRPADEKLYAGNCEKIKALGWIEKYQYEETLKEIVEYWRKKLASGK